MTYHQWLVLLLRHLQSEEYCLRMKLKSFQRICFCQIRWIGKVLFKTLLMPGKLIFWLMSPRLLFPLHSK